MNITDAMQTRYSTKEFNTAKTIPESDWQQIESCLRLSASSTNVQPWHFVIAKTVEGKARLAKGAEGDFSFNKPKILGASHSVLFCSRFDTPDEFLQKVLDAEDEAGRYAKPEFKANVDNVRRMFIDIHKKQLDDLPHWLEKQVYLNVGGALTAAAVLGIDAIPMEGIDTKALNDEFGLEPKGYRALVMVCFGYRAESDFNAKLPKSRLPAADIITAV